MFMFFIKKPHLEVIQCCWVLRSWQMCLHWKMLFNVSYKQYLFPLLNSVNCGVETDQWQRNNFNEQFDKSQHLPTKYCRSCRQNSNANHGPAGNKLLYTALWNLSILLVTSLWAAFKHHTAHTSLTQGG